jgi:large subunit ribosomal protein L9
MAIEVLLLQDINELKRAGEVHKVAPGYARNFLIPKKFAIIADKNTIRKQQRLSEERAKRAADDLSNARNLASQVESLVLTSVVKVDPNGHMYGSVTITDIHKLFELAGLTIEKRWIHLPHALKETGVHALALRLNEGVTAPYSVHIMTEEEKANA